VYGLGEAQPVLEQRISCDVSGATFPRLFAHLEDAAQHMRRTIQYDHERFACRSSGISLPEGAVSLLSVAFHAEHGVQRVCR